MAVKKATIRVNDTPPAEDTIINSLDIIVFIIFFMYIVYMI